MPRELMSALRGVSRLGKGVLQAVENVNTIINDALTGMLVTEQEPIEPGMVTKLLSCYLNG